MFVCYYYFLSQYGTVPVRYGTVDMLIIIGTVPAQGTGTRCSRVQIVPVSGMT